MQIEPSKEGTRRRDVNDKMRFYKRVVGILFWVVFALYVRSFVYDVLIPKIENTSVAVLLKMSLAAYLV